MAAKKKATRSAAPKKAAPKKAPAKAKGRAKRYPQELKDKIVAFAKAQGRGGQKAAAEKFGASPISVGQWVKKAGGKAKKSTQAAKPTSKGGSIYSRIGALANDIEMMEGNLAAKKAELKKLNAQI